MTRTANDNNNINSRPTTDSNEKTWQKYTKGGIKPYLSNWKAPGCAKTTNSYKFNYKHHQTRPPPPCSSVKLGFLVHVVPLHPSTSKNIAESSRTLQDEHTVQANGSKRMKPYSFDSDLNFRTSYPTRFKLILLCTGPEHPQLKPTKLGRPAARSSSHTSVEPLKNRQMHILHNVTVCLFYPCIMGWLLSVYSFSLALHSTTLWHHYEFMPCQTLHIESGRSTPSWKPDTIYQCYQQQDNKNEQTNNLMQKKTWAKVAAMLLLVAKPQC